MSIIRKNIHKIFKPIDNWLNWAFATGTFTFQQNNNNKSKSKQGVAQVYNILSYQSKLSHTRRLNSPSDKNNGKIVAPRKLNPTQLVLYVLLKHLKDSLWSCAKNFSLSCYITPSCNPELVEQWCLCNDVIKPNIEFSSFPINDAYLNAKILINRRFIGLHYNVTKFIRDFKQARHKKIINPYISIEWDSQYNYVYIYTDSGRVIRPVYTVTDNKLNITKLEIDKIEKLDDLLINDDAINYIEFIDSNEIKNCLIAITPDGSLTKNHSPFIKFAHCRCILVFFWCRISNSIS